MARMKHGPYGPIVGKVGNTVGYIRLGQPIVRTVPSSPKRKKKGTLAQQAARKRFSLVTGFIGRINRFTNISFKVKAQTQVGKTAQNMAMSANLKNIIVGEFPDYEIDYSKALVSEGGLSLPANAQVELVGKQLKYTWDVNPYDNYTEKFSEVMMLAYFPGSKKVNFDLGGAKRYKGVDVLDIHFRSDEDTFVEVYMSFVSADRESVSNSIYLKRMAL
ncbi:MAG: hypothetical protein EOO92_08970 [Pedobacter sp.]|nr:MAG: hypothetical protein EOO92_08970 [Pedobacter sp.]